MLEKFRANATETGAKAMAGSTYAHFQPAQAWLMKA